MNRIICWPSMLSAALIGIAALGGASAGATPDYDADGVLRVAYFGMNRMPLAFDEETGLLYGEGTTHLGMLRYVIGTPLTVDREGNVVPFLAEGFEVVDDSTMNLTLREGLLFHDGTAYTAQVLADTMLGYQQLDTVAFSDTVLTDIESIDVVSDTELTFHLSRPVVGLLPSTLTSQAGYVVSPSSDPPETLYGAGPYQIAEFEPGERLLVEKFDDYWDADSYLLAGIDYIEIGDFEAAQNALLAGQVDLISTNARIVDALVAQGPFAEVVTVNQGYFMLGLCHPAPPFDDPRFREAFDLMLNREQINEVVFQGNSNALSSLWSDDSPYAVPGLIDTDGDQERAREILDEIGWDNDTTVTLGWFPGVQEQLSIAEVVVGQAEQVGIDVEIAAMEGFDVAQFVNPEVGGMIIVGNVQPGIRTVTAANRGERLFWNPCGLDDPELAAMADRVAAGDLSESDEVDAWTEMQEYIVSNHLWYPLVNFPAIYVYNTDRVQGVEPGTTTLTGGVAVSIYLEGVSIKPS